MGILDGILDGLNDRDARRAREAAIRSKNQQARGFNLILERLDQMDERLAGIEQELAELRRRH